MYCDFQYYTESYYGDVIPSNDFNRLCERASEKVDYYTSNRIDLSELDETTIDKVKKAVCCVSELLYDVQIAQTLERENGGQVVSSVSSGSESIHYGTAKQSTTYDAKADLNKSIYDSIKTYLSGTGLLYRGL